MRNVRLFYSKRGRMRFISHLDMTRFMTRLLRRANLPVWYTEGFNPHLYLTFALPLSLGFESEYEVMDIKITDDSLDISKIPQILNSTAPEYIHFFDVCEPILKASEIKYCSYTIKFDDGSNLLSPLENFFDLDSITVLKKTKKGELKEVEVADKIKGLQLKCEKGNTQLIITLPAGNEGNLNPELLLTSLFENGNNYYCYIINRTAILDANGNLFR